MQLEEERGEACVKATCVYACVSVRRANTRAGKVNRNAVSSREKVEGDGRRRLCELVEPDPFVGTDAIHSIAAAHCIFIKYIINNNLLISYSQVRLLCTSTCQVCACGYFKAEFGFSSLRSTIEWWGRATILGDDSSRQHLGTRFCFGFFRFLFGFWAKLLRGLFYRRLNHTVVNRNLF